MAALQAIDTTLDYVSSYDFELALDAQQKENLLKKLPCSPSSERNKEPIFQQLKSLLPEHGIVLEIGSNTGQHCQYIGQQIYSSNLKAQIKCQWQPTDYVPDNFQMIQQRINLSAVNIRSFALKPKILNLLDADWEKGYSSGNVRLIYIANVIHISPWECSIGLFRGSGSILGKGQKLVIYGPQIINDGHHDVKNTSNQRFSVNLKSRNPQWGVRNLEDVVKLAAQYGLRKDAKIDMPANNYIIVFEKQ